MVNKIEDFVRVHLKKYVQFISFCLVGVTNVVVSYVSYLIFLKLNIFYIVASFLSFVISVSNSFFWNNKYVFRTDKKDLKYSLKKYAKTFISYGITGIILTNILLFIWVDKLGIKETTAPLINYVITIPLNFVLNKYWAFSE